MHVYRKLYRKIQKTKSLCKIQDCQLKNEVMRLFVLKAQTFEIKSTHITGVKHTEKCPAYVRHSIEI